MLSNFNPPLSILSKHLLTFNNLNCQKAQNSKYCWIAELTEIYELDENGEIAEGPKQQLYLIWFEVTEMPKIASYGWYFLNPWNGHYGGYH